MASPSRFSARFFRHPLLVQFYRNCLLSTRRGPRLMGLAVLSLAFALRSVHQWGSPLRLRLAAALAVAACEALLLTKPAALLAVCLLGSAALVLACAALPDDETGHRAGWEGYSGRHCENTVEAALELIERDAREGPLPHFPYLEFDVQETADGQLVVFHDSLLGRAFPTDKEGSHNAAAAARLQADTGLPFHMLTVQDLTLAQLQSLHLGGRPNLLVPTLQHFMDACEAAGVRRSLAIEVKLLRTDDARQQCVEAISEYLRKSSPRLDADSLARRHRCRWLGWAGVISFPHLFPASFGEYGSDQWRRWAAEFRRRGIRVRSCHVLWLSLIGRGG